MNTIITNQDYREMLKRQKINEYRMVFWILSGIGVFVLVEGLIVSYFSSDDILEVFVWFLLPFGILVIVAFIFYFLARNVERNAFESPIYQNYVDYQTVGTKVPLYRVVSHGRSSETVNMILDINGAELKFLDIRRKKLRPFFNCQKDEITFHFFYKNKQGIDILKKKLHLEVLGKKRRIYIMKEVAERFIPFLKTEGFKYTEN